MRSDSPGASVVFENKDGKGVTVQLNALTVAGKLVMRVHEPKPEG
jgi:hypothetical protein